MALAVDGRLSPLSVLSRDTAVAGRCLGRAAEGGSGTVTLIGLESFRLAIEKRTMGLEERRSVQFAGNRAFTSETWPMSIG